MRGIILIFVFILLMTLSLIPLAYANTYVYSNTAANELSSFAPNLNHPCYTCNFYYNTPDTTYTLVKYSSFDITNSDFIDTSVLSINGEHNSYYPNNNYVQIRSVSSTWDPSTVTWNTRPGIGSLSDKKILTSIGIYDFNVLNPTKGWVSNNYGLYILLNTTIDHVGGYYYGSSSSITITTIIPTLSLPINNSAISVSYPAGTASVDFAWNGAKNGYNIQVSKYPSFNTTEIDTNINPNSYTASNLPVGFTYYWRVREYVDGQYGGWSSVYIFNINSYYGTAIQGTIYEILNGTSNPIDQASLFIYNTTSSSTQITGINGYYLVTRLKNDTYYIKVSKDGYDDSQIQTVTPSNGTISTQDILMRRTVSPYITNYIYTQFTVIDQNGQPYSDVAITIYEGDSLNVYLSGKTDSTGSVVFKLTKDIRYRATWIKASDSINLENHIFATEQGITMVVPKIITSDNIANDLIYSLDNTTINASYMNLTLTYQDKSNRTSSLTFFVKYPNGTVRNTVTVAYPGYPSAVTFGFVVPSTPGTTMKWGFNASNNKWGSVSQMRLITFAGNQIDIGVSDSRIYTWFSIGIIILIAGMGSVLNRKYLYVILPLVAGTLTWKGWLPVPWPIIITMLVIGIIAYMREKEETPGYA